MRVDEMVAAVLLKAKLSSSDNDYTAARIRQELTDACGAVFGKPIVKARSGYWLKQQALACDGEKFRFRLPYRAFSTESVEIVNSAGRYEIIGDQVVFDAPPSSDLDVLFTYYIAPSLLTQEQTAGLVTAVNVDTATVIVAALPLNRVTGVAIATGDRLDIVHQNGWHELSLVGEVCAITGSGPYSISFNGADLSDVESGTTGDYVRAAGQTDWPCLHESFHPALCTVTAARISRARGAYARAAELEKEVSGEDGDMARFIRVIEPRVQDAPRVVVPRNILIRRGRSRRRNTANTFG
ncbi:MAG TPA: hypothetical protein VHM19_22880 [Polyangiales bacterium]|nr:hypothetical protein [Polyangiales bacterium]